MRLVLLLLGAWLLIAAAPIRHGPLTRCPAVDSAAGCVGVQRSAVRLDGAETILRREIVIDTAALQGRPPLIVSLIALASAEVRWNGVVIGRNGAPGPDRAHEVPGRYVASFIIPPRLLRDGRNVLTIRLSGQHLWLPVRVPIHDIGVGFYESPALPGVYAYLPALLTLGALLVGMAYFGIAFLADRTDRQALTVALAAAAGAAQLVVGVSRAFVAYTYPWHLARVSAIALLAAATACLISAYAARRFAPARTSLAVGLTAAAASASLVFVPWYDLKALGALVAGFLMLGLCAASARRFGDREAAAGLGAAITGLLLIAWDGTDYLDRTHYLLLAALVIALVSEQVIALRRARAERDEQTRLATALAARLREAEQAGEPILALRDGSRVHRVAEGDVLAIRAADDYCDVSLAGGRELLVTMTLARLLASLPPRFLRVHKSHAVNRAHVTGTAPRPGGGTLLTLSDGREVPVGRSYARAVGEWLRPSPSGG